MALIFGAAMMDGVNGLMAAPAMRNHPARLS